MTETKGFRKEPTGLAGVYLIYPFYAPDTRGFFLKSYEKNIYEELKLEAEIQEDFESFSRKDVIRGLHFQTKNPQIKLVRVIRGDALDVLVDLRKSSNTFGKSVSFNLNENKPVSLWIPAGFAHGFRALSEEGVLMSYKCIGRYEKGYDSGIRWNDPDLDIDWGITDPMLSDRDKELPLFKDFLKNIGGL